MYTRGDRPHLHQRKAHENLANNKAAATPFRTAIRLVRLAQAGAAETFQVALSVRVMLDRYLVHDPGERNVGLRAAKLLERGHRDLDLTGHAGGSGEHAVGAGVIPAQANRGAR